jgi:DMSO/TMAO reductase YedYZ molybdopterin-dependent catalytic subunit
MKCRITLSAILFALVLVFTGCGQSAPDTTGDEGAAISIPDFSITVEVVGEEPFEFTDELAREIGPTEMTAAQKDQENMLEEQTWTGIKLTDLLKYAGVEEYSVIEVKAADGFSQELDPARVDEAGTGFGWAVDGELLDDESGPVELVNNGRGSKWWIKQVSSVTIIK